MEDFTVTRRPEVVNGWTISVRTFHDGEEWQAVKDGRVGCHNKDYVQVVAWAKKNN